MPNINGDNVKFGKWLEGERSITVDVVECKKIRLADENGELVGTIGIRYADRQLAVSFETINLRGGNVYLPDLSHVYVLRDGESVTLASVLGL